MLKGGFRTLAVPSMRYPVKLPAYEVAAMLLGTASCTPWFRQGNALLHSVAAVPLAVVALWQVYKRRCASCPGVPGCFEGMLADSWWWFLNMKPQTVGVADVCASASLWYCCESFHMKCVAYKV